MFISTQVRMMVLLNFHVTSSDVESIFNKITSRTIETAMILLCVNTEPELLQENTYKPPRQKIPETMAF
jgi:hypothetical protein